MYTPPHRSPIAWENDSDDPHAVPKDALLIRDRENICEILGALVRHGRDAELRQGERRLPLKPRAYSDELDIVQWTLDTPLESGAITIDVEGYNCLYRVQVDEWMQHGDRLTTNVPRTLVKVQKRWQRRKRVTGMQLHCTLPSGKTVDQTLRDISYQGLSIYHDDALDGLLLAGEVVNAELAIRDAEPVTIKAKVVEVSTSDEGDVCHLKILESPKRLRRWAKVVDDRLHPGTRCGSEHGADIWRLFVESGYLAKAGEEDDNEESQASFFNVLEQLDAAPHLGSQIVWPRPDGDGIHAALSMLKVYEHTWLSFQMARLTARDDDVSEAKVLRDVYMRAYEHAQKDSDLKWIVAYSEADEDWSRKLHKRLSRDRMHAEDIVATPFHALRFEVDSFGEGEGDGVDRPSAEELHALATKISRRRPAAYSDALDLVPERLSLQDTRRRFARTSMGRDRVVLVARDKGEAKAAAVVEMTSDGLHVFGLLDLVRLYSLTDDGHEHYAHLLAGCARWYREKHKKRFCLYLEEHQTLDDVTRARAADLGHAQMLILPAERLPEFFETLYTMTSPKVQDFPLSAPAPQ